jgi:GNAT superfamily N-acetyltransferase
LKNSTETFAGTRTGRIATECIMNRITIEKVERNTALAQKLIRFVTDFSWEEVREHTLHMLESWAFTDWEAVFAAVDGERVVGMVTLLKTDYYPLPEVYPWISTLFVTEAYRGRRISQKLVAHAGAYAKELGFAQTYIPSTHTGLYEKYGYRYVRDIVNYGGETDRLYVRETAAAKDTF